MSITQLPFQSTGYFSKLICDYIERKDTIEDLYGNFPDLDGFQSQIGLKRKQFSQDNRNVLFESLTKQYEGITISKNTLENVELLKNENSFTVVTGHQLNVFTGPLYFLFKIVSAINLAKQLKEKFPSEDFVPVYWMATEDHDFEEINHFFVGDEKIQWDVESAGPVGRKSTKSMESVYEQFSKTLGSGSNASFLKDLFQKAYLNHSSLAKATRYLVNELFGPFGLVIVDGDDKELKKRFTPYAEKELLEQYAHNSIADTNKFLEENYKVQVNPREINLFYIEDELRERIVLEECIYKVNNTSIKFTKDEIMAELNSCPEKFSPNVIMRPLYQEVVLPNLCYIGGGGELAYWFQLKQLFVQSGVVFPILLLRNSVLLASKKQREKLERIGLGYNDLFLKQHKLFDKIVSDCCQLDLNFEKQKNLLQTMFDELKPLIAQTDVSFKGALEAQEKKQLKGLHSLEKRLLKAEKRKYSDLLDRAKLLQDALFPRQGLQERNVNFSEFYESYGPDLITTLLQELDPLSHKYLVIEL